MTRIGIIGIGNMGSGHAKNLVAGKVKNGQLVAVCDIKPARLEWAKETLGEDVKLYDNYKDLLADKDIDGVLIATPHYDHPSLVIETFKSGKHVLSEKPAGVYVKQVEEMNAEAAKHDVTFSIMYNQRTNPLYQKVRDLVKGGELGEIRRVNWIITSWYRPQSYYNSGGWRATWEGEGGGVLLNQCPHQLDLWQWICGMPKRIRGFCHWGKMHDIEVEDDVTAYMEYENGATGIFIASTGDCPGTNRLEITGDNGKIVIEDKKIIFYRNRINERVFNETFDRGFGSPEVWKCEIPIKGEETGHVGIMQNWVNGINGKEELLSPGIEGVFGLTLSNAIYLSDWEDRWVDLPMDNDLYYSHLKEKIANSTKVIDGEDKVLSVKGTH